MLSVKVCRRTGLSDPEDYSLLRPQPMPPHPPLVSHPPPPPTVFAISAPLPPSALPPCASASGCLLVDCAPKSYVAHGMDSQSVSQSVSRSPPAPPLPGRSSRGTKTAPSLRPSVRFFGVALCQSVAVVFRQNSRFIRNAFSAPEFGRRKTLWGVHIFVCYLPGPRRGVQGGEQVPNLTLLRHGLR